MIVMLSMKEKFQVTKYYREKCFKILIKPCKSAMYRRVSYSPIRKLDELSVTEDFLTTAAPGKERFC
jgi:hypothetical protein